MPLEMMVFVPWLITVVTEEIVALLWKFCRPKELLVVLLVNTVTNVPLGVLKIFMDLYFPPVRIRICIIALEVIIFFAEAAMYRSFLERCRHPYWFSLSCNAASFAAGLLIFGLIL